MGSNKSLQRILLILLAAVLVLGVALLVYFKLDQIADTADQISSEKAGLEQDRARLAKLELFATQEDELKDQYKRAELLIPDEPEEERLVVYLLEQSVDAGVRLTDIKFGQRVQEDQYVDMPIEITFLGSYESLIEFLGNVREGERAVRIDTIAARDTGEGTNDIRVDIRAHSFSQKMR